MGQFIDLFDKEMKQVSSHAYAKKYYEAIRLCAGHKSDKGRLNILYNELKLGKSFKNQFQTPKHFFSYLWELYLIDLLKQNKYKPESKGLEDKGQIDAYVENFYPGRDLIVEALAIDPSIEKIETNTKFHPADKDSGMICMADPNDFFTGLLYDRIGKKNKRFEAHVTNRPLA